MYGSNMIYWFLNLLYSINCLLSGHIQKRGPLTVGGQQAFVRGAQYTTALCLTAPTVGGVNLKPLPPHLTCLPPCLIHILSILRGSLYMPYWLDPSILRGYISIYAILARSIHSQGLYMPYWLDPSILRGYICHTG